MTYRPHAPFSTRTFDLVYVKNGYKILLFFCKILRRYGLQLLLDVRNQILITLCSNILKNTPRVS